MRRSLKLTLVTAIFAAALVFAQATDPALQGSWTVIAAQHGGKPMDGLSGGVMTVTGERFEIQTASGNQLKGVLKLDKSKKPAVMDLMHDSGMHWEAIYQVDGEDFKLNYVPAGGKDKRPTAFKTSPDTEASIVILKRKGLEKTGMKEDERRHFLRRFVFAATPEGEQMLGRASPEEAMRRLFDHAKRSPLPALPEFAREPWRNPALRFESTTPTEFAAMRAEAARINAEQSEALRRWWIEQMISTPAPWRENLTVFFHGVLGGSSRTVDAPHALYSYNVLLRQRCLGTIPDLLEALVLDPAMMIQETIDESRKELPSEYAARRILEKWTVGPGSFNDDDAENLGRALTGWVLEAEPGKAPSQKVDPRGNRTNRRTGLTAVFHEDYFDNHPKTILGKTSNFGAKDAVRWLALQEVTARRYGGLLIRYFGVDDPRRRLEAQLTKTYIATAGSIEAMLRDLSTSAEFWSAGSRWNLIKSPVHLSVGAVRQLKITEPPVAAISDWLAASGQRLFDTPESGAEGWPGGEAWLTPSGRLAARYQLGVVVLGGTPAWGLKPTRVTAPESSWTPADPSPARLLAILDPAPGLTARQIDKQSARDSVRTILASPEYQVA